MKWNQGTQFENPPPGITVGRCFQIIDLGSQKHVNKVSGESWMQRDVRIAFETPTLLMKGEFDEKYKGKPFSVTLGFGGVLKQSLNPKAALYKFIIGWKGKKLSKEEIATFDDKAMLGKPAMVTLQASEDGEYINVAALAPMMAGMKCPKAINPPVYFSIDEFNQEVFDALPEGLRNKIKLSPEYFKLFGGEPEGEQQHSGEPEGEGKPPQSDDEPF